MKRHISDFDFKSLYLEQEQFKSIGEAMEYADKVNDDVLDYKRENIIYLLDSFIERSPYEVNGKRGYKKGSCYVFKQVFGSDIDALTMGLIEKMIEGFSVYLGKGSHMSILQGMDKNRVITSKDLSAALKVFERALDRSSLSSKYWTLSNTQRRVLLNTKLAVKVYSDILAEKRSPYNKILRPTEEGLRGLFEDDANLRAYLRINLIPRDVGFGPLFFDFVTETDIMAGKYGLHHKERAKYWSVFIRDLLLANSYSHGVWSSRKFDDGQHADILQQGLQMLIERGTIRYQKGVEIPDLIDETDIEDVFTILGGGTQYSIPVTNPATSSDETRTVLEWWKHGSDTGVKSSRSFQERLLEFNRRIAYLADNNPEMLVTWIYPTIGPVWIDKGKDQMDVYLLMKNHPSVSVSEQVRKYYVHLEDVDLVRNNWGVSL
jgi:hypothetical protein